MAHNSNDVSKSDGRFQSNRAFETETPYNMHNAIASWFLGPQAENKDLLVNLFAGVVEEQAKARKAYHPEDGAFITASMIDSKEFKENVEKLQESFYGLSRLLNTYSVPFSSPRYAGHMTFETSMPAILGWILTILFNPNNVAFEASPITTLLEKDVGSQMCEMLGYDTYIKPEPGNTKPEPKKVVSWGHIACDGTIANMESMWSARNLKFYPLSLRAAMEKGEVLEFCAQTLKVYTCRNTTEKVLFSRLSSWELVNLSTDVILSLPEDLHDQCGVSQDFLGKALKPFLVQEQGKDGLLKRFSVKEPQYLISATRHYSWPKSAALTGIGAHNAVSIPVDQQARMSIDKLRGELQKHLDEEQPVYAVVAVIGTTEEGAVDPLDKVIELRNEFQAKGLSFIVHADAAWGGFFACMIRSKSPKMPERRRDEVFEFSLREYTVDQFRALKNADSITVDPHKAGYVPYPAGGLCYRDGRMRYLVTWTAPYVDHGNPDQSIGVYGIEGSKPGASAVAAWLHFLVVGLHSRGQGALLGEVIWTSSRLSAHWLTLSDKSTTNFIIKPFNPCDDPKSLEIIRTRIIGKDNATVHSDKGACCVLRELGSDLNINVFCLNFHLDGKINDDVEEANFLNNAVYRALSIVDKPVEVVELPMFLSATTFEMETYGECCTNYKERLGLETQSNQDLFVLRNVVMSPFQSAGDFVSNIADILRGVVDEKTKMVIERNTIKASELWFIVQSKKKDSQDKIKNVHLVLVPQFHNANYRTQLILRARISFEEIGIDDPDRPQILVVKNTKIEDIIVAETLHCELVDAKILDCEQIDESKGSLKVIVDNIKVVKNRTLQSRYRDPDYPHEMPFYLYGQQNEVFVDHMLLRAPNVQITTTKPISLLGLALTDEQLAKGVLAFVDVNERAAQPFSKEDLTRLSAVDREFTVYIYDDRNPVDAKGPGLAEKQGPSIASGKLKFPAWTWVSDHVNQHRDPPSVGDNLPHKSLDDLLREIPIVLPLPYSMNEPSSASKLRMYSLEAGHGSGFTMPTSNTAKAVGAWVDVMSNALPSFRN